MKFRAFHLSAIVLALAGCASFDPHNILGRRGSEQQRNFDAIEFRREDPASVRAMREQTIASVWRTVKDRYYRTDFNGVDWDAALATWRPRILEASDEDAYWSRLDQMVGELGDSHTRVESPKQVEARRNQRVMTLGIGLREIDGQLIVVSVSNDSDAFFAGVRAGMVITQIQAMPALETWRGWIAASRKSSSETARRSAAARQLNEIARSSADGVSLEFARHDGVRERSQLKPREASTRALVSHRVLPSGAGYVRLTAFSEWLRPELLRAIDSLKDAPGIVLDLRGNRGGSAAMADALIGAFFKEKTLIGKTQTRTNQPVTLAFGAFKLIDVERSVPGRADAYTGKLVVLIDADSASASEAVASALQSTGRAHLAGETTCGCLLAFLGYAQLNQGGELAYSEVGYEDINGKRIENEGVSPNSLIAKSVDDLRVGRDRTLEAGSNWLARSKQ